MGSPENIPTDSLMNVSDVTFMLIAGTLALLLLATTMILFVIYYQKRLLKQRLTIQEIRTESQSQLLDASIEGMENERRRIAQDMHDNVGAMLSTARMGIHQLERSFPKDSPEVKVTKETKKLMDEIIQTVRQLSKDLLPASLDEFGLSDAVEELAGRIRNTSGINVNFTMEGNLERLDGKDELSLYRVVQELLNNIIKHAEASEIDILIQQSGKHLRISITDNGKGFTPDSVKQKPAGERGLGLYSIQSRLELLDAKIELSCASGGWDKSDYRFGYVS